MSDTYISDSIKYIGADDTTLDLFESQYIVPNGVSYNSYIIMDEKIAVMDTVDQRKTDEWFDNLNKALDGKTPDYLVVSHLEPDHAANIQNFVEKYPTAKLVLSIKAKAMMPQFFEIDNLDDICITVKEGDTLELGEHKLTFIMAPMVHWPEVMVEYEEKENSITEDEIQELVINLTDNPTIITPKTQSIKTVKQKEAPRAVIQYGGVEYSAIGVVEIPKIGGKKDD